MKKERFFGKNGQTAFLGAAVLVLLICYIDNFPWWKRLDPYLFSACGS